ncbi:hypothetical protein [Nocardia farcinica]|uniref:hypothetical protein n=1 Tax=Nocardia farcinica TaxID=37329 RepID=UPI000E1BEBAB|nr:hypothetical protein [Nocardia farcinica]
MTRPEAPELCPRCGEPLVQLPLGRRRKWCSDYCRRRADEEGLKVHEVVRERERVVYRPERVSREQQIARLLDDPEATEQLLRTLAYRWRHTAPDPAARQQIAPTLLELWQAFHARIDPHTAQHPPAKIPTVAAEQRAAVERVLSSPRSTASVINRVTDRLDAGELRSGRDEAILNAIAYLTTRRRFPRR